METSATNSQSDKSLADLTKQLSEQTTALASKEVELAKAELARKGKRLGMGAGMNGWELADAVKLRWPGMRFMLATGWGAAIDLDAAHSRGVETVLSKPYHRVDLLRALRPHDTAA